MKFKLSVDLLDKMDYAIFKRFNENHKPATWFAIKKAFWGFLVLMGAVFLVQMGVKDQDTQDAILAVLLLGLLGYLFYSLRAPLTSFDRWWKGVIYGIYLFVIFMIMMQLAMWVFMGLLACAVFYLIYWVFLKPKSGVMKVTYGDGSTEKMKVHGMGALGDYHGTDKNGNDVSFDDPDNKLL